MGLPIVSVTYDDRQQFLENLTRKELGELFVHTLDTQAMGLPLGGVARLEVQFSTDPEKIFRVSGKVVARYARRVNPGLTFAFVPYDVDARNLLLRHANGELVPFAKRAQPRIPVSLPVTCEGGTAYGAEALEDLSEKGAFVRTERQVPVRAFIKMKVSSLDLDAQVMWRREGAGLQRGLGVRFIFREKSQMAGVQKLLRTA